MNIYLKKIYIFICNTYVFCIKIYFSNETYIFLHKFFFCEKALFSKKVFLKKLFNFFLQQMNSHS